MGELELAQLQLPELRSHRCCDCYSEHRNPGPFCLPCKRRRGLTAANLRLKRFVRWCAACGYIYRRHRKVVRRLLLDHGFDAGAAIASLARFPERLEWLRVDLWRCVVNDPQWDPERDEWDGTRNWHPSRLQAEWLTRGLINLAGGGKPRRGLPPSPALLFLLRAEAMSRGTGLRLAGAQYVPGYGLLPEMALDVREDRIGGPRG